MSFRDGIRGFFGAIGRAFEFARIALANAIVALILFLILAAIFSAPGPTTVPRHSALLLAPSGSIVEERTQLAPISILSGPVGAETRLGDIIEAIETAADDARVAMLVVDPTQIAYASSAQLEAIGGALDHFKKTGKPIVAYGEYFSQGQYYLASFADELYLHPMGQLLLTGYGAYQGYFQGLLEKLKVRVHVFRAGTFKSAVEPFTRSDMSAEAKEANQALVDQLWAGYASRIAENRGLAQAAIDAYAQDFDDILRAAGGDMARVALEHGLVDELLTPEEVEQRIEARVGEEDGVFRHADLGTYLAATRSPLLPTQKNTVGVIVARGDILMGDQPRGTVGADSIIKLIRHAREEESVKAVVLRIDSPGGSALASELIRQELELLQMTGKPVIASMGGAAASGGYWIAATADQIWAAPTTITGSIGVFGILPTFEDSLSAIGVERDGVATGPLAGTNDPLAGMSAEMASILQASVDNTYERFVALVARGRDIEPTTVNEIAQGRVWSGTDALRLGLIDSLGHLDEAIEAAANAADLTDYEVRFIEQPMSPQEQLIRQLTDSLGLAQTKLTGLASQFIDQIQWLERMNDPASVYAICATCRAARAF